MAESFENLDDILSDWANEDLVKSLAEAVDSYVKQEEERKTRFSVANNLTKILEQSRQSSATKRNSKWIMKSFQGWKLSISFEFNKLNKQTLSKIDLFEKNYFLSVKIFFYTDWCQEKIHHNTTS